MEPLVEIPREQWPALRDLYLANWPEGAPAYCLLDTQIANPLLAEQFNLKVYCPEGKLTNGMIVISKKNDHMIQPIGKDVFKIEEALLTTKIIKWDSVLVPSASDTVIACLERVKSQLGLNVLYGGESRADKHLLVKNTQKQDLVLPDNTYIGPLRPEHVAIVDKTWNYHGKDTYCFFELLMKNNLSYVLYSKGDEGAEGEREETVADEPLAWLSVNDFGALTHLYCAEQHRRKGYAELITKYVTNDLLSKNMNVIAYTTEYNVGPKRLFRKLGFRDVGTDHWVLIHKQND